MFDKLVNGAIERFFRDLIESAINVFLSLTNSINTVTITVLDMPIVNNAILYTQGLAFSIVVVKFAFEIWYHHILRQEGDSDADLLGVFINMGRSIFIIAAVPWLTKQMYVLGTGVASDISALDGASEAVDYGLLMGVIGHIQSSMGASSFILAVAILAALAILLIVILQAFIRAAELAIVAVSGSLMALGLTNDNSQMFQVWWRELLSLSLAQAIQILLVKISFYMLLLSTNNPMLNLLFFTGFIWMAYKSPSVLKQYLYSTGLGGAVGGSLKSIGSMVMMRRMMKA